MAATTADVKRKSRPDGKPQKAAAEGPLSAIELDKMDAYWRASNYLSVGQIYLLDNPLLKQPLKREHIKPRLLGHWGTSPGLNMLCVHLNRVIQRDDLDMIYIIGPGHGGPSLAREQIPQPGPRRVRAADPASQRLQDRQPVLPGADSARGTAEVLRGDGLQAVLRAGERPRGRSPAVGRRARYGRGGD